MPVPPVVITTCTSGFASCALTTSRTCAGSSFTIACPVTVWPAAVSALAIARPLVSLSSVRVSLTVRTKQRIDFGAAARCSASARGGMAACYHRACAGLDQPRNYESTNKTHLGFVFSCFRGSLDRGDAGGCHAQAPAGPRRGSLGRADAEEAHARRKNRPAARDIAERNVHRRRQRRVRSAAASRARRESRRHPRLRRFRADARSDAESGVRQRRKRGTQR